MSSLGKSKIAYKYGRLEGREGWMEGKTFVYPPPPAERRESNAIS